MKHTYYFRHDHNARNDERILELRAEFGYEGYGVFWALVESMAESSDGYLNKGAIGGLSTGLGIAKDKITAIIDMCVTLGLFIEKGGLVSSRRVLEHKNEISLYRESGQKGAKVRWKDHYKGAKAPPNEGGDAYKSREDKSREDKKTSSVALATRDDIELAKSLAVGLINTNMAFANKYTVDDPVLEKKVRSWAEDIEKMRRIDRVPAEHIAMTIRWLFSSSHKDAIFWRGNIQSGSTLREKFPKLIPAIEREYRQDDGKKAAIIS